MSLNFKSIGGVSIGSTLVYKILIDDLIVWEKATDKDYFYIEAILDLTISKYSGYEGKLTLVVSKDKKNWQVFTSMSLSASEKIYVRSNYCYNTNNPYPAACPFVTTGQFNIGGNVMSLAKGGTTTTDTLNLNDTSMNDYLFMNLFTNSRLADASNLKLPSMTLTKGCYLNMFSYCAVTSYTLLPELPATTLAESCYEYMFNGCSSLKDSPVLPATTLAKACYMYMLSNCVALKVPPVLPATTLAESCYEYMLYNDGSLATPPELPAMNLATRCYSYMFYNSGLTKVPELPAMTLADSCYKGMFNKCSKLTKPHSILPATTLAPSCYYYMFAECAKLEAVPKLPATTLVDQCYYRMFYSCSALKLYTSANPTRNILVRIPAEGTGTTYDGAMGDMFYLTGGSWTGTPAINTTYYSEVTDALLITATTSTTVLFVKKNSTADIYCKKPNASSWTKVGASSSISLNAGQTAKFAGKQTSASTSNYTLFYIYGDATVSGNIMAMFNNSSILPCDYACYLMFKDCTRITKIPELPSTYLTNNCYENMFYGCSNLKLSEILTGSYLTEFRIPKEGSVISSGANATNNMFTNTGGTFKGTPTLEKTYYGAW